MLSETTFANMVELSKNKTEGLVLLGAGGDLQEWVDGITNILKEEGIANKKFEVTSALHVNTTGGRTDLLLLFDWKKVNTGKLAIWRIEFGDCSWLSDYVVNYRDQHSLIEWPEEVRVADYDYEEEVD